MLGLAIILAYALDILVGDPPYRFHPARLIGRMIQFYETRLRQALQDESRAGMLLAFGLPADIFLITFFILWFAGEIDPLVYIGLSSFFIYSAISVKDMADHAWVVKESLERRNLEEARLLLSHIVERDTAGLDEKEIVRATVETVAESTLDGIISPLFYAAVGGAPRS